MPIGKEKNKPIGIRNCGINKEVRKKVRVIRQEKRGCTRANEHSASEEHRKVSYKKSD